MADELIDICDENNVLLGFQKLKSEAHKEGLWHRAAHIWIYNSKKELKKESNNYVPHGEYWFEILNEVKKKLST